MEIDLQPLPYHLAVRDLLRAGHPELWEWFASDEAQVEHGEAVALELLKSSYRMGAEKHAELYAIAEEVRVAFGIEVPVTLYQSQDVGGASAALYFTPGAGHVVFVGDVLELLDESELKALIAHELAHFKLWTDAEGEFLVADRVLIAVSNDTRAEPAHYHTARLYQLFTEIYADRGALAVTGTAGPAVSTLVKIHTGLKNADADSYIAQAEEIFAKEKFKSDGATHPEAFIRARALALWAAQDEADAAASDDVERQIADMIGGGLDIDALDLVAQRRLEAQTRVFIAAAMAPAFMRSGANRSHARRFFPEFEVESEPADADRVAVRESYAAAEPKTRDYFQYLLLDFATADREIGEAGLAAAFTFAEELGAADEFEAVVRKELKLLKRDTTRIRKTAPELIAAAEAQWADGGADEDETEDADA